MVICQGCGQAFEVPAGYSRNKIQCPGCGVICAVPADAAPRGRKAPAAKPQPEPSFEDQAAGWLEEPGPAPLFDDEPAPLPKPAAKAKAKEKPAAKPAEALVTCRRCGRKIRKQRECPACDGAEEPAVARVAPHSLELDEPTPAVTDEDDASPYLMADKDLPVCPKCRKMLPDPEAVFCTGCGYDFQTRKKAVRTFEPIDRRWDSDMGLSQRLFFFGLGQAIHWALALIATLTFEGGWPFVVTWPFLTAMLSFVLGTYERIELERDRKGRVKITRRWRFCFVPLAPVTTDVRGFEGVTTGQWNDAGPLEWTIFGVLFVSGYGVIPALIYWYKAIYQVHFHVGLALDHGRTEVYIYRGSSDEQMNDIADTICNASGLRRVG